MNRIEKPIGHHKAPNRAEMIGRVFGKLTVLSYSGVSTNRNIRYLCRCKCGAKKDVCGSALRRGLTKSCGCSQFEKPKGAASPSYDHGHTYKPTYSSWKGMIQRCKNPNNPKYKNYGARGITVCEEWNTFSNFLRDMGERPSVQYSIGRIDNNRNYEPGNCRWETPKQQAQNKTNNRLLTFNGKTMTTAEWSSEIGISYVALRMRLHRGWSIERTLTI